MHFPLIKESDVPLIACAERVLIYFISRALVYICIVDRTYIYLLQC